MKSEWPISASVKRIVATAEAPAPTKTAATTKRGPARKTARSAGRRNGSVQSTRMTCSPKTIVVADVVNDIVFRMIGSVPHSAAATATKTTPGTAASFRRTPVRLPRHSRRDFEAAVEAEQGVEDPLPVRPADRERPDEALRSRG